ncbi:putative iron-regulated membrane protein, partial [Neobacillus niacini]|nr:putative iron-regulated membrane protein [Neobacillus niacini]
MLDLFLLHFLLFLPLLVQSTYLSHRLKQVIYKEYYEVTEQGDKIAASEQIGEVKRLYPGAVITKYRPGENATRSSEVSILSNGKSITVFL